MDQSVKVIAFMVSDGSRSAAPTAFAVGKGNLAGAMRTDRMHGTHCQGLRSSHMLR